MEVEDQFEIRIADEDAQKIQTCGDLHAYLLDRLHPANPCQSAAAFYRVRSVLMRHLSVARDQIRPAALIHKLLGEAHARWPAIATDLNLGPHYSFGGTTSIYLPAAYTTLANLARRMAFPHWVGRPIPQDALAQEIWQKLRQIISDQFGTRPSEIRPETHFINDLGAG